MIFLTKGQHRFGARWSRRFPEVTRRRKVLPIATRSCHDHVSLGYPLRRHSPRPTHRFRSNRRLPCTTPSDPVQIHLISLISHILIPPSLISQPTLQMFLWLNLGLFDPSSWGGGGIDGKGRVTFNVPESVDVETVLSEKSSV
jgi:hypothetical protein